MGIVSDALKRDGLAVGNRTVEFVGVTASASACA
jgi:hypothetical protein